MLALLLSNTEQSAHSSHQLSRMEIFVWTLCRQPKLLFW